MVFLLVGPEINEQDRVTLSTTGWFYGSWWLFANAKLLRRLESRSQLDLQENGCHGGGIRGKDVRAAAGRGVGGEGTCGWRYGFDMLETITVQRGIHHLTKVFLLLETFQRDRGDIRHTHVLNRAQELNTQVTQASRSLA